MRFILKYIKKLIKKNKHGMLIKIIKDNKYEWSIFNYKTLLFWCFKKQNNNILPIVYIIKELKLYVPLLMITKSFYNNLDLYKYFLHNHNHHFDHKFTKSRGLNPFMNCSQIRKYIFNNNLTDFSCFVDNYQCHMYMDVCKNNYEIMKFVYSPIVLNKYRYEYNISCYISKDIIYSIMQINDKKNFEYGINFIKFACSDYVIDIFTSNNDIRTYNTYKNLQEGIGRIYVA